MELIFIKLAVTLCILIILNVIAGLYTVGNDAWQKRLTASVTILFAAFAALGLSAVWVFL